MKNICVEIIIGVFCFLFTTTSIAQPDPSVTSPVITFIPNTNFVINSVSFKLQNLGDTTSLTPSTYARVTVKISFTQLKPLNFNTSDITGTGAAFFNWTYDLVSNSVIGILNQTWSHLAGGIVTVNNLTPAGESMKSNPNLGFRAAVAVPNQINFDRTNDVATATTYSQTPLPVTIISFTGIENKCQAELKWITALEINSDYYEVQQSIDGISFSSIGQVKSSNKANGSSYESMYPQSTQLAYYRLKVVDKDGTVKYSTVIPIKINCIAGSLINVYPNPVIDIVNVTNFTNDSKVSLIGIDGKVLLNTTTASSQLTINMNKYPAGVYVLKVTSKTGLSTSNAIIKK